MLAVFGATLLLSNVNVESNVDWSQLVIDPLAEPTTPGCDQMPYLASPQLLEGPGASGVTRPSWVKELKAWRDDCTRALYREAMLRGEVPDDAEQLRRGTWQPGAELITSDAPSLKWVRGAYVQAQFHPYDRYFYNETTRKFTPQRFLADLRRRYGGVQGLLFWPTYTNLGIDDRNAYDLIRDMPGGLKAIQKVIQELHDSGVGVLWPYIVWDQGTRPETEELDPRKVQRTRSHRELEPHEATLRLIDESGADGMHGDTIAHMPKRFWDEDLKPAIQPELGGSFESLSWTTMGWGEQGWTGELFSRKSESKVRFSQDQFFAPILSRPFSPSMFFRPCSCPCSCAHYFPLHVTPPHLHPPHVPFIRRRMCSLPGQP